MQRFKNNWRLSWLAPLSLVASCASLPPKAPGACSQAAPLTPELTEPALPPLWFSTCLRQITDSQVIDSDCLKPLEPWLTTKTTP